MRGDRVGSQGTWGVSWGVGVALILGPAGGQGEVAEEGGYEANIGGGGGPWRSGGGGAGSDEWETRTLGSRGSSHLDLLSLDDSFQHF